MDAVSRVRRLGGVARRATLLEKGLTRHAIDRAVAAGSLQRLLPGVLSLPGIDSDRVRACYFRGRITCLSAAQLWDLRLLRRPQSLHLEIPAERGGTVTPSAVRADLRVHRTRTFTPGSPRVDIARALDVMGVCVDPLAQLVALDHALARKDIVLADVQGFRLTSVQRRRWLEAHADARSGSVPETCARVALKRAGLTVETQAPIGDWRHADFLVEGVLFVEIDGESYHSDPRQFAEDRHRDRAIVANGGRVIRFTYADAVLRPERLVADVTSALAAIRRG